MAEGVEREELEVVLPPGRDSIGVMLVGLDVAWVAAWSCSTVSARFSLGGGASRWGPLYGAKLLSSSLIKAYINSA